MATDTHFQLFPPPVPKITADAPQTLHRVRTFTKTHPSPVESLSKSANSESIIIKIVEQPDRESISSEQAEESQSQSESRSPSPQYEQETVPSSPIDGHRPTPITIPPPIHARPASPAKSVAPTKHDPSPISPVVPIRSMFPTYNPTVSLGQQNYYPQRVENLRGQNVSREEYNPSMYSPSRNNSVTGGPRTAPASIVEFPSDVLALKEPHFSSVKDLEKLWEATNGTEPENVLGHFDLRMSRYVIGFSAISGLY